MKVMAATTSRRPKREHSFRSETMCRCRRTLSHPPRRRSRRSKRTPMGMGLDAPPMQPPDVTSQTGFAGVGQMMADKAKQDNPMAAAGAGGALLAQGDAVEKVLTQMAKNDKFKPFANRIIAILKAGMAEASGAPQGGPAAQGQPPEPMSARPPEGEAQKGFPG